MAIGLGRLVMTPGLCRHRRRSHQADCPLDQLRETVEALGLPMVTFHQLRHTHASPLIAAKVDVVTVSKRLGHANPAITLKVYAHLFDNSDAAAADAINQALGANPVPKKG
jgi:integrase